MRHFTFLLAGLLAWLPLGSASLYAGADPLADSVVIVVNANDSDSLEIGRYYAERRGIPEDQIIALDAPLEETISLRDYVQKLHNPLLQELRDRGWISGVPASEPDDLGRERMLAVVHEISYLVTVRGIPLRVANDPELLPATATNLPEQFRVNRAAVDSELSLLTAPPAAGMAAFVPNPYFERAAVSGPDASRVIKVSRLDGPTRRDVFRLIDRTLEAEETGLMGRAYFDLGGPHPKGDEWLRAAQEAAEAAFFETSIEESRRPLGFEDRLDAPAIYMGWYQSRAYGPFRQSGWSVPPGAIGFHLHSFSATTVRAADQGWLGPLVAQGYAATFGNVYEPYLEYTHRPQIVLQHLLAGGNFGDAIYRSLPALSWQGVAIGDPLYRPFAKDLDTQVAADPDGPFAGYLSLRDLARRLDADPGEATLAWGRAAFAERPSLPLAYRLARLCEQQGEDRQVTEVLRFIRFINSFPIDEMALVRRIADLLHQHGASDLAIDLYEKMLDQRNLPKGLRIALLEPAAATAAEAGETRLASNWSLELQRLRAPQQ